MCYRLSNCLPLVAILGACAAMEAMGLATPEGDPTTQGQALNDLFAGLTGLDILKVWGGVKGAETLLTKRGRDNLKNAVDPKTGLKGTVQSVGAILFGQHSPEQAKKPSK